MVCLSGTLARKGSNGQRTHTTCTPLHSCPTLRRIPLVEQSRVGAYLIYDNALMFNVDYLAYLRMRQNRSGSAQRTASWNGYSGQWEERRWTSFC
jgi:hypothetical protein